MIISIINMSDGVLLDADLQTGIRAVNRQLTYDFAPTGALAGSCVSKARPASDRGSIRPT